MKVSDNKIAIKSGFGRYVSCGTTGELVGRAEAIGPRELWETVFENVRVDYQAVSLSISISLGTLLML